MGVLAMILGILGGACAIMGVLTALEVIAEVASLGWSFWFGLATILLLGSIASVLGRTQYE